MRLLPLLLLLAACGSPARVPDPRPYDPERDGAEAVELLRELIRFDTTNPPPPGSGRAHADESALLRHVAGLLAADGIDSRIHESAPGRGNLVARVRGTGSKPAVLLMAHVDVVAVDRPSWTADPFGAELRGGYIWGRGALDDKDDAAVFVQVLRILHRTREPLDRDVILMLNADEESSGRMGAEWMVRNRWEEIACGTVISEGGSALLREGRVAQAGIQTAEKIYNDVRIVVRGESGHSSVPGPRNAITEAAKLIAKAEGYRPPLKVHEAVKASLAGLAGARELAPHEALMRRAAAGEAAAVEELARDPRFNAQLRTTFAPTLIRGGIRENVLPPDVEVNLNVRLLPGERLDDFLRGLMGHLGVAAYAVSEGAAKGKGEIEVVVADRGVEAPGSPIDHEAFRALEAALRRLAPDAVVVPRLATGATDLRFFRAKGVPSYGIAPCPAGELEEGTPHHHDERVAVSSVSWGVRYVLEALRELAGLRPRR